MSIVAQKAEAMTTIPLSGAMYGMHEGLWIEMWANQVAKTIETAYPVVL